METTSSPDFNENEVDLMRKYRCALHWGLRGMMALGDRRRVKDHATSPSEWRKSWLSPIVPVFNQLKHINLLKTLKEARNDLDEFRAVLLRLGLWNIKEEEREKGEPGQRGR